MHNTDKFLEDSYKLDKWISQNNINYEKLSVQQKEIVKEVLNGNVDLSSINSILYNFKIPTIQEFVTDSRWLGQLSKQIYPFWKQVLFDFFDPKNSQTELVLSGCAGGGKTTVIRIAILYGIVRLLALKNAHQVLNIGSDLIVCALLTLTLGKAQLALIEPFKSMLEESNIFEAVTDKRAFANYKGSKLPYLANSDNMVWFKSKILLIPGSKLAHALSLSIPLAFLDEAEFRGEQVVRTLESYQEVKNRMKNRFMNCRFVNSYMASSAGSSTGVVATYKKQLEEGWEKYTKYIAEPIWVIKSHEFNNDKTFYVMRGTPNNPSKILTEEETVAYEAKEWTVPANCLLLAVPVELRKEFVENGVQKALRDIAGESTVTDDMPFDDFTGLEYSWLPAEFNLNAPIENTIPLIDLLPRELFDPITGSFLRCPNAPRYSHIDAAVAEGSEFGWTIAHKELGENGEVLIVFDVVAVLTAPTRIDFMAFFQLKKDLKEKHNVNFHTISSDQFQSVQMRQMLDKDGIAEHVIYLSVDRDPAAYRLAANMVRQQKVKTGQCPKLKNQASKIAIDIKENKVYIINEKKDEMDSFVGTIFLAMSNTADYPTHQFKEYSYVSKQVDLNKFRKVKLD